MHESEDSKDQPAPSPDERRAQLIAAARAARSWVNTRRTPAAAEEMMQAPAPPDVQPPVDRPVPQPFIEPIAEPETDVDFESELTPEGESGPSRASLVATRTLELTARAARSVAAGIGAATRLLVAQSRVLAWVAAVLLIVAAAWAVRTYLRRPPAVPAAGTVVMESTPDPAGITIDGILTGRTPMTRYLSPGRHVIEFRRRNATRTINLDVVGGTSVVQRVDWNEKGLGRLRVDSTPAGAKVTVDGHERGVTPLDLEDLSVGTHAVVLDSASGVVRRTVTIAAGKTTEMAEAIYAGWVQIASPIELKIFERGRAVSLDDHEQVMLSPGSHDLVVENASLGYKETRRIDVKPGALTRVTIVPSPSALTVTATGPAEVWVDGIRIGETPVSNHPIRLGTRDVVVRAQSGAERHYTLTVTAAPAKVDADFSQP